MYNTSNPAELYPGTTWELLPENKLLKTGSTPLQQGGSNSLKLSKANLPAERLQVDSFSVTIPPHNHKIGYSADGGWGQGNGFSRRAPGRIQGHLYSELNDGSNSGTATPYTTAMGSGTPLAINPEYITIRAWKRLT